MCNPIGFAQGAFIYLFIYLFCVHHQRFNLISLHLKLILHGVHLNMSYRDSVFETVLCSFRDGGSNCRKRAAYTRFRRWRWWCCQGATALENERHMTGFEGGDGSVVTTLENEYTLLEGEGVRGYP